MCSNLSQSTIFSGLCFTEILPDVEFSSIAQAQQTCESSVYVPFRGRENNNIDNYKHSNRLTGSQTTMETAFVINDYLVTHGI